MTPCPSASSRHFRSSLSTLSYERPCVLVKGVYLSAMLPTFLRHFREAHHPVSRAQIHAESIFRYAILEVYRLKLGRIVSLFEKHTAKHNALTTWDGLYLKAFEDGMRTSWSTAATPNVVPGRVWSEGEVRRYWSQYSGVFNADWTRLDAARVQLMHDFRESRALPDINSVVRQTCSPTSLSV